jgi:hypothetical protein
MPGVKKSAPNYCGGQSLQPLRPENEGRIEAIESGSIGWSNPAVCTHPGAPSPERAAVGFQAK